MNRISRLFAGAIVALASAVATAAPLDDGQIIEVLHTANGGEIKAGQLAASKAKRADVKSFAKMMVDEHTTADKKGSDLASKLKVSTKKSDLSSKLSTDADTDAKNLKAASAADFDRVYMDAQVADHTQVLSTIETQLMTSVKAPELQSMLKEARTMVSGHLEKAKSLRASMK